MVVDLSQHLRSNHMFARIKEIWNMGCVAVGATIYFGSQNPIVKFKRSLLHLQWHMEFNGNDFVVLSQKSWIGS